MNNRSQDFVYGAAAVSGGVGILAALTLEIGFGTVGGLLALLQQCLLVGLPLSLVLGIHLFRTWRVVLVMAFVLSLGLSALASQVLIWFEVAYPPLSVAAATAYGIVVALVLRPAMPRRDGNTGKLEGRRA